MLKDLIVSFLLAICLYAAVAIAVEFLTFLVGMFSFIATVAIIFFVIRSSKWDSYIE